MAAKSVYGLAQMADGTINQNEIYERCLLPFNLRNVHRFAQKNSNSLTHRLSTALRVNSANGYLTVNYQVN